MHPRRWSLGVAVVFSSLALGTAPAHATFAHEQFGEGAQPLAGVHIVIDPGHQLGNSSHPAQVNRLVDAGGFMKPCNTTGTATNGGYPEATFTFRVAVKLRQRLQGLGAHVTMTRYRNSRRLWGPCVDVRGKFGNQGFRGRKHDAALKISLHGDGAAAYDRGFHVIVATKRAERHRSTVLGHDVRAALGRAGFPRSTYIGGGTAMDYRGDLGTLNWSHIPTVLIELGNMRNAQDAVRMVSASGQRAYARALARAVRKFLDL